MDCIQDIKGGFPKFVEQWGLPKTVPVVNYSGDFESKPAFNKKCFLKWLKNLLSLKNS